MAEQVVGPSEPIVISHELSNKTKMYSHPKYKLTQLYPITSANQNNTITAAGGTDITFQLPVKVMNFAKSYLSLTLTPGAPGNDLANVLHASPLSFIRQIQLYTQAGIYLTDLYYANQYMNTVYFPETSYDKFSTNETLSQFVTNTWGIGAQPNNLPGETVGTIGAAGPPIVLGGTNYARRAATDNTGALLTVADDSTRALNYKEKLYFIVGNQNNTPVLKIKFPMGELKNTILSMNRDLYFGEVLQLRFVLESRNSVGFIATGVDAVRPVGTKYVPDVSVGAAVLPADIQISNVTFFAAIEQDLSIAQQLINHVNTQGLTISIPYVYSYKTSISAASSQTLSLRFNRAHGKKLRRIYHAPTHANETGIRAYLRENLNGAKTITSLYTLLNNDRLQEFNVDCTSAQDWMTLRHKLEKSCYSNADTYQAAWFWVDDFTSEEPLHSQASQDITMSSGIDLTSEQKWDIYMTTTTRDLNHYTFAITEKTLTIRPGSTSVM